MRTNKIKKVKPSKSEVVRQILFGSDSNNVTELKRSTIAYSTDTC